jgi:branched-chain amino acid transport system ATP-binding protein
MTENSNQETVLLLKDISKSFGGVDAVCNVNFAMKYGENCALIGPNGAGKTTLFNLITGEIQADKGGICLFENDITNTHVQHRNMLGMGRTYQISNLFLKLTVKESLFLALWEKRGKRSLPIFRPWSKYTMESEQAREFAHMIGLESRLETTVEKLSHGERRKLELGIAIASKPKIILMDEPTAGLSSTERISIIKLITKLTSKMMILLIEHNMLVVHSIVNRVIVMDRGFIIADGSPKSISSDKQVQKIYMIEPEGKN